MPSKKYYQAKKDFKLMQTELAMLQCFKQKSYILGSGHCTMYGSGKHRETALKLLPEQAKVHKVTTIAEFYSLKLKKAPEDITYKDILTCM